MTSEHDITLQTSGYLTLNFMKKGMGYTTQQGSTYYQVSLVEQSYGPPNAPPPSWTKGKEYTSSLPQQCPNFGVFTPSQWVYPFGCLSPITINDMSPKTVLPGKTYAFVLQVYTNLRVKLLLTGSESGTTVIPSFGLLSLPGNPGGYTYVAPEPGWDGEWSAGLLTPYSSTVMRLGIEYSPPKDYGQAISSYMTFSIEGALGNPSGAVSLAGPPDIGEDAGPCFLLENRTDAYRTLDPQGGEPRG